MPETRKAPPAAVEPLLHRAARVENQIHRFREKRARKRGLLPTIVPYTGYGSTRWVRVLSRVLLTRTGSLEGTDRLNVRGWRSFTSVPVEGAVVEVAIGGRTHRVSTDRGGVLDVRIDVDLSPGWHVATLSTEGSPPVDAPLLVIDPEARFGIVSDIDDTVMVTSLPRPFLAAWNTFVLNEHARRPVPGMAVMYERLHSAASACPVVYLSTGAWNVAPTLSRFLSRNLYPSGPLLLTDWGPTHDRWFRSGRLHKQTSLDRLAEEFPRMRWLLVGDDGQHDEELYGRFLRDHRENVAAVAIRQLSPSEAVLAGGRSRAEHAEGSDVAWVSAPDGAGLWDQLRWSGAVPVDAERDL
ncbi:phosphatidate phosphatase APP1 [Frigoribacterium sp. PhB160]|uniref:App1 family protein n=1 Tax=Frigoribacterium sp. PhB160 TaxID=2485192 RepID=UPI000F48027E|nr:phosphatase domain-containing protein [Frigoribacterium sp. PhB160]ROS62114.1 phosphatidate phosphatase APP1 [Frigoribacterium sp. PhB160]